MKKLFVTFVLLFIPFCFISSQSICFAEDEEFDDVAIENELEEATNEQLSSFDFNDLQDVLDGFCDEQKHVFGGTSFYDKVLRLINGDFGDGITSFFNAFVNTFFGDIVGFVPFLSTIIIITILCSIISSLRADSKQNGVGEIVNFVCFGAVCLIVSSICISIFGDVKNCIVSMQSQMQIIFPMLLTILASIGGTISVGIYQPAVAVLSQVIVSVFMFIIMPIFVFMFVLTIVNNFTNNIKLNKMLDFFKSLLKWISTISFGAFLGILGVQGIVAGSFDGVSFRAAKFALKSYVPILGGYLSDGFNVAVAGSVLIKNALGVSGIFLILATVFTPVLRIVACLLMLKLTAAILEPTTGTTVPNFLYQTSKILGLLVMILLAIIFMYVITIGLIMSTANIV